MNIIIERFNKIKSNIDQNVEIVAISKTFPIDHIKPLIDHGHRHFGENKVQEAEAKWKSIKSEIKDLNLHMVGKLQTNKAKKAVEVFDYIHSLDSQKLADNLSKFEIQLKKKRKYFIQVNVGKEKQKSGIDPDQLDPFYNYCINEKKLNVIGLMTIPPNDGNAEKYFKYLYETNVALGLQHLSMGMSADYKKAIEYKTTFVRIGSLIFGDRS